MITWHFIKMLILFTLVLAVGFAVIAFAEWDGEPVTKATVLESLMKHLGAGQK